MAKDKEQILEDLVLKMAKAIDNKNHQTFLNLKASFLCLATKNQQPRSYNSKAVQCVNVKKETEDRIIDCLKKSIKINNWARIVKARWANLSEKEKSKYSDNSENAKLGFKYSGAKFASTIEAKRQNLHKNGIFISREAFYELMSLGYKPEAIAKKGQDYILPILGKRTKLVFNSENDFMQYIKKHENNFNEGVTKIMEG